MSEKQKVLFVDDEPMFARAYVEALEKNFDVIYRTNVQDGMIAIRTLPDLRLLVLDIMMPPPEEVPEEEVEGGLGTGVFMLKQIKSRVISKNRPLPVVILTNRRPDVVEQAVRNQGFTEDFVSIRQKNDTPAFFLPRLVTQSIQRWYPE